MRDADDDDNHDATMMMTFATGLPRRPKALSAEKVSKQRRTLETSGTQKEDLHPTSSC